MVSPGEILVHYKTSRNSTAQISTDIPKSSNDSSGAVFQTDLQHRQRGMASQQGPTELPRSPFVDQIYGLTPRGNKRQRHGDATKHKMGWLKSFSQHLHKTHMRKDKDAFQDDSRDCESPSKNRVKQANTSVVKDIMDSAEDIDILVDCNAKDRIIKRAINEDPIPLNGSLYDSSSDKSTTVESNDFIPFMNEDPAATNCGTISVEIHDDQRDNVEDRVDSDYKSSSPRSSEYLTPATSDGESKTVSPGEILVRYKTSRNSTALVLEHTEFFEQMCKLSFSAKEDRKPSAMSAYIHHAGMPPAEAKLFLECLYLHDESLKHAGKVCIGYESETPDEPIYLVFYSTVVPDFTCPKLNNTFRIIYRSIGCVSEEAKFISDMEINRQLNFSEADLKRIHTCLAKNTPILMKEHSNLLMVSASKLKSEGYGTTQSKIYENTCLVLYVDVKGFIPFGEKPFMRQIEEFPVDVREGVFKTFSDPKDYHESLVMGCQIVTSYNTCGTLGAFVQLRDGYLGCLTCCHVFETPESVIDYTKDPVSLSYFKTEAYQPAPSNEYKFGNAATFFQDSGDENNIGVDAALIVLNAPQRYPKNGDFPTINCAIAGFSEEKPMIFNSGEIIQRFDDIKLPCQVVKYGATTGLTIGLLHSYGSAVQMPGPSFLPGGKVPLHQQLEVFSIKEPFAQEGDSGSLVFCVCTVGETTELKALGLLVGGGTSGNVIVTPIWAILNKLQLPLKLFRFDGSHRKLNASAIENPILLKIEADVDGLKARLDAISSSMAKKEDIDRIIQHLQQTSIPSAATTNDSIMITDV